MNYYQGIMLCGRVRIGKRMLTALLLDTVYSVLFFFLTKRFDINQMAWSSESFSVLPDSQAAISILKCTE